MKRVIVSVTNDITTDQRVLKVCESLYNNGFEILLIGRLLNDSLPLKRPYKTKRLKLFFNKSFLFYAEFNLRLFLVLLFSKKDILLSNDLDTLLPNYMVSKIQRKKIVYDSHEYFTEVPELINKPLVKKVWTKIENFIFPKLKNVYTVNKSIADIYSSTYKVQVKIIKNLPKLKPLKKVKIPFERKHDKVIIYQGAINVGRGLELMIDTVKIMTNIKFIIIGKGDILKDLKERVNKENLQEKVIFLGSKTPDELKSITPLADIGMSLEEDLGLNYRYALPNKLFDYIHAKIPVISSDLIEMKRVIEEYKVGEVLTNRNPVHLKKSIETILSKDYSSTLKKAKQELNWNTEEKKLLTIFNNLK